MRLDVDGVLASRNRSRRAPRKRFRIYETQYQHRDGTGRGPGNRRSRPFDSHRSPPRRACCSGTVRPYPETKKRGKLMSLREAFLKGIRSINGTKRVVFWLFLSSIFLALVPTLLVSRSIQGSLGKSMASERMKAGFDDTWYREFRSSAKGLAGTFDPTVEGVGAILNSLDDFLSGDLFRKFQGVLALGALYLLLWTFAAGGILDLFDGGGPPSFERFMSASASYFGRFLRLAILLGILYWILYHYVLSGLSTLVGDLTRNTVDERVVFAWTALKYLVFVALLVQVNILSDYGKILSVLEKRHSVILAVLRALRLEVRHPVRVIGLYLAVSLVGVLLLVIYGFVAPGGLQQSWGGVMLALVLGQLYILSRIWTRFLFLASQTELCRSLTGTASESTL